MRVRLRYPIILIATFISSISNSANVTSKSLITQKITGTAYNKDKQFVYTEEDTTQLKDNHIQRIDSLYKDKDSKLIVEMHSVFSKKPFLPDISFNDHRKKTEFKMVYNEGENVVSISQNFADPKVIKSKKLDYLDNMINSMGLINYIRENFNSAKEKAKTFRYVIPALIDDYGMVLDFRENLEKMDPIVKFAFRIESFFVRNLAGVSETIIGFDRGGNFIKEFNGISNILDDTNHTIEVQITYTEPVIVKTK